MKSLIREIKHEAFHTAAGGGFGSELYSLLGLLRTAAYATFAGMSSRFSPERLWHDDPFPIQNKHVEMVG